MKNIIYSTGRHAIFYSLRIPFSMYVNRGNQITSTITIFLYFNFIIANEINMHIE
jgi:hypothetical protein